jgi:site-specific DNA-methyltransferase (adenine-specific)
MSRFILGNCIDVMRGFPDRAVDLIVTDPPYLVGFKDRSGRAIAGDVTDEWLQPATLEMYRVLKKDALMVSFYGWNRVDRFMAAWKAAGFYAVGQIVFTKTYSSNRRNAKVRRGFVDYCHEGAYVLAKGRPVPPEKPLPDVLPFPYTGNPLHPTQKPVEALQPLIESFSAPGAIVLTPLPAAVRPVSPHTVPDVAISASKCWRSTTEPEPDDWPPCTGPLIPRRRTMNGSRRRRDELRRTQSPAPQHGRAGQ